MVLLDNISKVSSWTAEIGYFGSSRNNSFVYVHICNM